MYDFEQYFYSSNVFRSNSTLFAFGKLKEYRNLKLERKPQVTPNLSQEGKLA